MHHYLSFSLTMGLLIALCMILSARRRQFRRSGKHDSIHKPLLAGIIITSVATIVLFVFQVIHH